MENKVEEYLNEQYYNLTKAAPIKDRAAILYNIAYFKECNPAATNYSQSLYLDIKNFIKYYLKDIGDYDYGYDHLNKSKFEIISLLPAKQQISLYKYTQRLLKKYNYDGGWLDDYIIKAEKRDISSNICYNLKNILNSPTSIGKVIIDLFRLTRVCCMQNIYSLLISLFIFFFLIVIVLLPAPKDSMQLFTIETTPFCNNFLANHIFNVINYIFDISIDSTKITPINGWGVIFLMFSKILFYLIIIDFLIKNLLQRISFKDE